MLVLVVNVVLQHSTNSTDSTLHTKNCTCSCACLFMHTHTHALSCAPSAIDTNKSVFHTVQQTQVPNCIPLMVADCVPLTVADCVPLTVADCVPLTVADCAPLMVAD